VVVCGGHREVLTAQVPGGPNPSWRPPTFIGLSLFDVRVIMVILRVLVEEFAMSGSDGTDYST
jgi:hypothetical protein